MGCIRRSVSSQKQPQVNGSTCDGTNINIFNSKSDVYVDGGPAHEGAAGLPDGFYYIQVTEPGGTLLELFRFTPVSVIVAPDDYVVSEFDPAETNWIHTTTNPVNVTVDAGETETVEFGNLCLGPGGGHTLGFWSNKNGQATMNDGGSLCPELTLLNGLYLRNGAGQCEQSWVCDRQCSDVGSEC